VNPFHYGSIVTDKDFCGRTEAVKQIQQHMDGGQNVVVYGERRVGKTSLIFEAIRRKRSHRALRLDLMNIKSIDTLCRKFISALGEMEQHAGFLEKFIRSIPALRPTVTIDPLTGMPTFGVDAAVALSASNLQQIIGLVKSAYHRKRLVVVIDEFQSVLDLENSQEVLAELRAQIQHAPEVPFFFAGSIRHQMESIFTSHDSPFFKSAIPMSIDPLTYDEFAPFLTERFEAGQRKVSAEYLEKIFSLSGGITGDVQQFCEAIWYVSEPGEEISQQHIASAINILISREKLSFQSALAKVTASQMGVLNALAVLGGKAPTSREFLAFAGSRNASSIKKALESMDKQKLVYHTEAGWKIMNPVFRLYLHLTMEPRATGLGKD
jgi:hypothetical protein